MEDISIVVREPDDMDVDTSLVSGDESTNASNFSLPKRPIEVVKKYDDFCVLSVSRGNGPRAVEEWIAKNRWQCFSALVESECKISDSGAENKGLEDDLFLPVLANPHNSACAHSLLLATRHPSFLKNLKFLRVTIHCLVKGMLKPGTQLSLSNVMEKQRCQTTAISLEVVPSNSAGYISLLVAHNSQNSTFIAPRQFRRHLNASGWPVLGGARDCYAFRGEKLCLSVIGLEFQVDGIKSKQSVSIAPVPRLRRTLEKEERFWRERKGVDGVRVELFGNGLPRPIAYVEEKAIFDGLEFRVTPAVMIPRKGSEALVDLVEDFFNAMSNPPKGPCVLDLGTGCGNLLLATLKRLCHLDAKGIGIDTVREVLDLCDYNIVALGMKDRARSLQGRFSDIQFLKHHPFDVVICNPPYMTTGGRRNLDASTTYEPEQALYVDRQNPNVHYEDVLNGLVKGKLIVPGALIVFEVCKENADAIANLMKAKKMERVEVGRDFKNCIRTVKGIFDPFTTVPSIKV